MRDVIILSGRSGSGKTEFAEMIYNSSVFDAAICTADDYFYQDGKYNFDASKLGEAHKWCREKFQKELDNGVPLVIMNNTNTRLEHVQPYIDAAHEAGYRVHWIFTAHHHEGKNTHGVPESTLEKQTQQLTELFSEIHK